MQPKVSQLAAIVVAATAALASVSSTACTIAPANPIRIKQLMANEIAHRLGMRPQQIPLHAITEPRLSTPFGLGADCSGLGAYHHSAGFRVWQSGWRDPGPGPGPGPDPWPDPGPGPQPWPEPYPGTGPHPGPGPWPGTGPRPRPGPGPGPGSGQYPQRQCVYEGAAVLLGYGYSSPVAVHFERRCR